MLKKLLVISSLLTLPSVILAENDNPFYAGLAIGYGNTNWSGLLAKDTASQTSTPIRVKGDRGLEGGAFAGVNVLKNLALEFRYQQFSNATIYMNPDQSGYYPPVNQFSTATRAYSLVSKFIVPFGESRFAGFATVGGVYTQRMDVLSKRAPSPPSQGGQPSGSNRNIGIMFGGGLNFDLTSHIRNTIEFSYGSGNGESIQYPLYTYIPFIYAVEYKIAYRFSLANLFSKSHNDDVNTALLDATTPIVHPQ